MLVAVLLPFMTMAQTMKKPTLMILPSDNWCEQRYFMTTFDNQGVKTKTPNYQQAFQEDQELPLVISKLGQLLIDYGYSIKDAEQETKAVNNRMAEESLMTSRSTDASIAQSPLDLIKQRAKMDIIIQIWWKVNREATGRSVSFTLEAFDAYTSKRIATSSGTGMGTDESIPVLLENAVKAHIKDFDKDMDNYFRDMRRKGREVVLNIRCWDDWEYRLDDEFGDTELLEIIQNWLRENTVKESFNLSDATDNFAQFEQVRMPLFDKDDKALDARAFISGLRKYLEKNYNIQSKVYIRGLGEAYLILGGK